MDKQLEYEESGIGIKNESNLHAAIKRWYARPGDRFEARVDGHVIDIVRNNLLIEIQTKNFKAISNKIKALLQNHCVQVTYPIPVERWITTSDKNGEMVRRRKSPKKGELIDIFDELVSMPGVINEANFSIEVLLVKEEEIRRDDGMGSWRRRGISIINRNLIEVVDKHKFSEAEDFLLFLPAKLPQRFTNKELSEALGVTLDKARKATYCLKKMELIREKGKRGRELEFEIWRRDL